MIICVDNNLDAYKHALRCHNASNIIYLYDNILNFKIEESYFDVVVIRGAIEHLTREEQQVIFQKSRKALKTGGWFVGDTVANPQKDHKLLTSHKNEWKDEHEMREELLGVYDYIETRTLRSKERVTLLWACKKTS